MLNLGDAQPWMAMRFLASLEMTGSFVLVPKLHLGTHVLRKLRFRQGRDPRPRNDNRGLILHEKHSFSYNSVPRSITPPKVEAAPNSSLRAPYRATRGCLSKKRRGQAKKREPRCGAVSRPPHCSTARSPHVVRRTLGCAGDLRSDGWLGQETGHSFSRDTKTTYAVCFSRGSAVTAAIWECERALCSETDALTCNEEPAR